MQIRHSIELDAPVSIVYELFRQPEELPRILQSLIEVTPEQPNGARYRVLVDRDGSTVRFDAELVQASPHLHIAWKHLNGAIESGQIEFVPLGDAVTRLDLELIQREGAELSELESIYKLVGAELVALQGLLADLDHSRWDDEATSEWQ